MNVAAASGILQERFKDLGSNKFTATIRRELLESAQIYLANKLHPDHLTDLQVEDT